jgi:tetratricopeptide (TPR) repeat protein
MAAFCLISWIALSPQTALLPGEPLLGEPGPESPPITLPVEALCGRGEHLIEDGSRESILDARRLFDAAAGYYPKSSCGHAGLSRTLLLIYQRMIEPDDALIDRALAEARLAVQLDSGSASALAALASALLIDLRPDEAAAQAEVALALAPDAIPALLAAAQIRIARGDHDLARAAINHALSLRPDLPAAHFTQGNLQLLSGKPGDAVESYKNAQRLSPGFLPAMFQQAAAMEELGQLEASGAMFQKLIEEHPEESAPIHLYMGRSLMRRNSWNAALAVLDKAAFRTRRGLSGGTVLYMKALCFEKLGRTGDARAAYRDLIDNWPDATGGAASPERLVFPAHEALGRLHFQAGEIDLGVSELEAGAASPDASLDLILRLARLYKDYGLQDRATTLLRKAALRSWTGKTAGKQLAVYLLWARISRDAADEPSLAALRGSLGAAVPAVKALGDYVYDLDAARAFSIAGAGDQALACLRHAVELGYSQLGWIATDPDLEALRRAPGYAELVTSARPAPRPTD